MGKTKGTAYRPICSRSDLFAVTAGAPISEPVWRELWNRGWLSTDSEPIAPVLTSKGVEEVTRCLQENTLF